MDYDDDFLFLLVHVHTAVRDLANYLSTKFRPPACDDDDGTEKKVVGDFVILGHQKMNDAEELRNRLIANGRMMKAHVKELAVMTNKLLLQESFTPHDKRTTTKLINFARDRDFRLSASISSSMRKCEPTDEANELDAFVKKHVYELPIGHIMSRKI